MGDAGVNRIKHPLELGEENPWRFLESLDASNPGDVDLLKRTRGNDLEVVRNLILSSKTTLCYAFSGNGKSSLINAGIIPAFHRSGYAVFRTRPRPAISVGNPSQAFKDCLLTEFWLPQRREDEALIAKARASLAEVAPHVREVLEPLLSRVGALVKDGAAAERQNSDFLRHFRSCSSLSLPEFVEEIQRWVGPDVPSLIVLDQFEELFVHYYNTFQIAEFISDLAQIYASRHLQTKFLFSMREDWVGSMVQLRQAIPDVFVSCFKLEPLRVSQALPALTDPPKRFGVSFEKDLPERILRDLSSFYSVLQKKSFASVRLTPSGEKDPYIELPALQVLMKQLWESCDLSAPKITLDSYLKLAPRELNNPAEHVLETYLSTHLHQQSAKDAQSEKEILADLRVDLLYLLTDRSAHRRAASNFSLLSEVKQIQAASVVTGASQSLELPHVERALEPLIDSKLVRRVVGLGGTRQYELTHDFLVRSVITLWNHLDRRRADEMVRYVERQQHGEKRLAQLSRIGIGVTNLVLTLSAVSLIAVAFLPSYWLLSGEAPAEDLGVFCLIGPVALLFASIYVRSKPAILLGLVALMGLLSFLVRNENHGYYYYTTDYSPWSGYLSLLVVVTVFLLPGVVVWVDQVRERHVGKMAWPKVAAVSLNYAYILALIMTWSFFLIRTRMRGDNTVLVLVTAIWILSQLVGIGLGKSTIGYLAHGLIRRSIDGRQYRVWIREAAGQGLSLAFAILCWTGLMQLEFIHFSTRAFLLSHILFLVVMIVLCFRSEGRQGFLDRLFGTELVGRPRGDDTGKSTADEKFLHPEAKASLREAGHDRGVKVPTRS